jgi:hypothetical protein
MSRPSSALLLILLVAASAASGYFYRHGVSSRDTGQSQAKLERPRIIMGEVLSLDPPSMRVKAMGERAGQVYEVLLSPNTTYFRLDEWASGEREIQLEKIERQMEEKKPKPGDVIPDLPGKMKLNRAAGENIRAGNVVGLYSEEPVELVPERTVIANIVRPLHPDEIKEGKVGQTFPSY